MKGFEYLYYWFNFVFGNTREETMVEITLLHWKTFKYLPLM